MLKFWRKDIKYTVDTMIYLMQKYPDRFTVGSNYLTDNETSYSYWTCNGPAWVSIYTPHSGEKFGYYHGSRFLKAVIKISFYKWRKAYEGKENK